MRYGVRTLLAVLLVILTAVPALAASGARGIPPIINPGIPGTIAKAPVPVAFSAVPNRYTDVDPSTVFDLNGDLVGDVQVSATNISGKNGATLLVIDPPALSLDLVQTAPATGYNTAVTTQLSRVYMVKLSDGGYAKFMLLQASPKVTIWFSYGKPTSSTLSADGTGGHAVLTWTALSDATLGYNIYRYEFLDDNSYTVTLLNDFTVTEPTFTDNTAENHYYLYVVVSIKDGGAFGNSTTVAAVNVQSLLRKLVISLTTGTATLDGTPVTLDAAPVVKNGRLMIPASALTAIGVKVNVDPSNGQIILSRRINDVTYTLVMTIDSADYTWNGGAYKADVPPYMQGSAAMIPLRIVAPSLGFGLTFNSTDRTASVQWFE